MGTKQTRERFIEKAKKIHGDRYNYDLVEYDGSYKRITIICSVHGTFSQTPRCHIAGRGCFKCKAGRPRQPMEDFVRAARLIHGQKYEYISYTKTLGAAIIECPEHGEFTVDPARQHLAGEGSGICPVCRKERTRKRNADRFISNATNLHNGFYDYSSIKYVNAHTLITIICPEHGPFVQLPLSHINQGSGCPLCVTGGYVSAISRLWLKTLDIADLEYEKTLFLTNGDKIRVDGYSPSSNTIYEFLGTWWHGHPDFYNSQDIHPRVNKTYGELYHCTMQRLTKTKDSGFNLEIMWEHDWAKISGKRNAPAARGVK